mgnify:CR=1 FL=1
MLTKKVEPILLKFSSRFFFWYTLGTMIRKNSNLFFWNWYLSNIDDRLWFWEFSAPAAYTCKKHMLWLNMDFNTIFKSGTPFQDLINTCAYNEPQ